MPAAWRHCLATALPSELETSTWARQRAAHQLQGLRRGNVPAEAPECRLNVCWVCRRHPRPRAYEPYTLPAVSALRGIAVGGDATDGRNLLRAQMEAIKAWLNKVEAVDERVSR